MNQMTTPRVCESLVEVELLRANSKNKKFFQSQLTVKAMGMIIREYMPATDLTNEQFDALWDIVHRQHGDSVVNGIRRCGTEDEFKCVGFHHRFFINVSDALAESYATVAVETKKGELKSERVGISV